MSVDAITFAVKMYLGLAGLAEYKKLYLTSVCM